MTSPAFESFVAPARVRPEMWRTLLGVVLITVVWLLWVLLVLGAVLATAGLEAFVAWMDRMTHASTPTSVLLLLATFVGLALGPMLAARLLHKRGWRSLFGATPRLAQGFVLAAVVALCVTVLAEFIWPSGFTPVPNLDLSLWLSFAPLAFLGILVQTGAEEIAFRGYLQQQMAARFRSPLAWMVLPALLFGSLHYNPQGGAEVALWVVAATTTFGLIAADLTRLTGSIGAAWGFHFVNNCFAILFVSLDGALSGLALYTTPFGTSDLDILRPLVLRDMVFMVTIWALVRLLWAKRG